MRPERIIFSTGNSGKMREVREALAPLGMEVIQRDLGYVEVQTSSLEEVARVGQGRLDWLLFLDGLNRALNELPRDKFLLASVADVSERPVQTGPAPPAAIRARLRQQEKAKGPKPLRIEVKFWKGTNFSADDVRQLRDLLAKGYHPSAVRYLLASVPHRRKLNFTFDGLKAAATAIERLRNFKLRLEAEKFPEGSSDAITRRTAEALARFEEAMDDDLNTAEALAAVFEYVREVNAAMDSGEFRAADTAAALDLLARFDSIFDVLKPDVEDQSLSLSLTLR